MTTVGVFLLIVGIVSLLFGVAMDTTVETTFGAVHNIGLMIRQQTVLLFGGALAIVGAILVGFGSRASTPGDTVGGESPTDQDSDTPDSTEPPQETERWVLWACGLTLLLILVLAMLSSIWDATH